MHTSRQQHAIIIANTHEMQTKQRRWPVTSLRQRRLEKSITLWSSSRTCSIATPTQNAKCRDAAEKAVLIDTNVSLTPHVLRLAYMHAHPFAAGLQRRPQILDEVQNTSCTNTILPSNPSYFCRRRQNTKSYIKLASTRWWEHNSKSRSTLIHTFFVEIITWY